MKGTAKFYLKVLSYFIILLLPVFDTLGQATIFTETVGTPSAASTAIPSYTGWSTSYTMTGTGTVDNQTPFSSGYTGASGNGPVMLLSKSSTIGGAEANWSISAINTASYTSITLSFGIYKQLSSSTGSYFVVEVSSDGVNYTALTMPALASGGGTPGWYYKTCTGTIPATSSLTIRFRNTSSLTSDNFRLDDIKLTGTLCSSSPSAPSATGGSRCGTGTVTLSASGSPGTYNWYTGSSGGNSLGTNSSYTTGSISNTTTYYVAAVATNGCESSTRTSVTATVNASPAATVTASGATTFCSGCSVTLTSSAANSYSWSNGSTTQSIVVTTSGSYSVTVTASNGCQNTSSSTSVTVNTCTSHTWSGTTSSSWSTASNWNKCIVPGAANDVTIPNVTTAPAISGAVSCNNLTINSGGVLTINSGGTLNIYGNITNNGTYTDNGTTVMTGTSAQSINGTTAFNNLTVNNSNGVTLNNSVTVNGILTLTTGTLSSAGYLNVNLNTGAIAGTGTGSISGNIRVYKTVSSSNYHMLSSPLSGMTVNDWNDNVAIRSYPTNLYYYDETSTDTSALVGWTGITNLSTPLTSMKGYALWFSGGATIDETGTYIHSASYSTGTLTNTVSGNPASDGWNLIGNPYPSTLDWYNGSGWTKTNVDDAIYFWDGVNSRYASYINGAGTNGGNQYIPSYQAFWVHVNAAGGTGSVMVNNNARVTTTNPSIYRKSSPPDLIRLSVASGNYSDETIVRFLDNATENFDRDADAYKLNNEGNTPSLYSTGNDQEYAINSLPESLREGTIPLKFIAAFTGSYTLSTDSLNNMTNIDSLILIDNFLNKKYDLKSNSKYTFNATAGKSDRFSLKVKRTTSETNQLPSGPLIDFLIKNNALQIMFLNNLSTYSTIEITDLSGHIVASYENEKIKEGMVTILLPDLPSSILLVKVLTPAATAVKKIYFGN